MLYSQGKDMNSFVIKKLYFYWKLPQKSQLTVRVLAAAWGFNERPADTSTEAQ